LFTRIRDETAETASETGAWSREAGQHPRLGVPKGVRLIREDFTRGLSPFVGMSEAGSRAEPATGGRHT